jgi:translocation and assembly module TamB
MSRLLKVLAGFVAVLVLLLAATAIGLWWWAGTQSSLDWALAQIAKSESVKAEGLQGSLRDGLKATRIQWEKDKLRVEVTDAELAWQPLAIARGTVRLDRLHAARLRIEDNRPPKPKEIPTNLALPFRVEIDDVRVAQLQWATPEQQVEVAGVAGEYTFNGVSHKAKLASAKWMQGSFSGEGSLNAAGTMAVDARLQGKLAAPVPGTQKSAPLSLEAKVGGKLNDMQVRAQLQGAPDSPTAGTSAQAQLRVTPFSEQPVPQADAQFQRLDVGALWAQAPHTALAGKLQVQPAGDKAWTLAIDATNAAPGPWSDHKLPVEQLNAAGEWRMQGVAVVRELHARAAGGTIDASGQWRTSGAWAVDGRIANIDPHAIQAQLESMPLSGAAQVKGEGALVDFDVDLKSASTPPGKLLAKGRWDGETLHLPTLDVRMNDATLQAVLDVQPRAKSGSGRASLDAPGLQARAEGKVGEHAGSGKLDLRAADLAQAAKWLARWPAMPGDIATQVGAGRADAQVAWQGGWSNAAVQARVNAHVEQAQRRIDVTASASAAPRGSGNWQGQLASLDASVMDPAIGKGAWALALQRPVDWRWAAARFEAGAGQALLRSPRVNDAPAQLAWDPVRWGGGQLQTAGRLTGLPLAWIELFGGPQLSGSAVTGDMVFDAQWDARLGTSPQIRASLARSRGDVTVLAENAEGHSVRVPAGVREARISVESNGEAVTATLRWDSEHGGTAEGHAATRLVRGGAAGWQWPDSAPLNGHLDARLPRIGVWSLLAPPGWRLRGSLVANVNVSGTKGDPQMAGTLAADDLALRSVVDGVEMQGGRLRARLEGRRVLVDEFILHGSGPNGGTLNAKGEGAWTAQGPQASMTAQLTRLRASIRSDRQLTVSGTVDARRDAGGTVVNGKLLVDQALIVLPEQGTPKLGDDVVVRNAPAPITKNEAKAAEAAAKPPQDKLQVAIDIDLGNDFRVQGNGLDTHLRGTLAVAGTSIAQPRITGTIRTSGGEYRAYGQRLDIERGIVRFTGSPENPALDLLAIRPNIVQRVGVQVTGTAFAPFVRLYSEPDLPDAEKLAWLVTGRPAPATGAESALVQQAALALLASRTAGGGKGIAGTLGLDELSFRREGSEGPSVTLGKRFSRNFYAAYERSLSGAIGTLYIFYDVTRRLTVRGQAGERTAVDLIYTLAFD